MKGATLALVALLSVFPRFSLAEETNELPTLILAVDGDGSTVRRKSRIEESARVGAKVYPGEIVQTGPRSSVQLMTTDGSLIKVGFGSKLKVEESTVSGSFVTWVGNLILGRMRALVTKQPGPAPRFRVNTPTAAMGVRGTEFVAVHDEASDTTYLYTLEGVMGFGQRDCDAAVSCLEVRAGETSVVRKGALPSNPSPFDVKELVRGRGGKEEEAAEVSLFKEARQAELSVKTDEGELRKLVAESSETLAEGQDRALGRTKEERIAINQAVANGSFVSVMHAADAYAKSNNLDLPDLGGAEEQVGATASDKFRLGAAVLQAKKDGLFAPNRAATTAATGASSEGEGYVLAKTVDFGKTSLLKNSTLRLSSASSTYLGSLSSTAEVTGTRSASPLAGMRISSGTLAGSTVSATRLSTTTLSATKLSATTLSATKLSTTTLSATTTVSRTLTRTGSTASNTVVSSATKSVTLTGTTTTVASTNTKLLSGTKLLAETTVDSTVARYTKTTAVKTSTLSKTSIATKSTTSSTTTTSAPKTATTISGGTCYTTKETCKLVPCSAYTTGGKVCTGGSKTECTSTKVAVPCK